MTATAYAITILEAKKRRLYSSIQKYDAIAKHLIDLTFNGTLDEHETHPIVSMLGDVDRSIDKLRNELCNVNGRIFELKYKQESI